MGVNFNSTSEAFVVQSPSKLTIGRIANGILRPAANPCFHVLKTGGVPRNTAILYNNINFNVGNGYNSATGVFTAPMAGIYHVKAEILLPNTAGEYRLFLIAAGKTSRYVIFYQGTTNSFHTLFVEGVYNFAKGDTVYCQYTGPADAAGAEQNNFSGHYVG